VKGSIGRKGEVKRDGERGRQGGKEPEKGGGTLAQKWGKTSA